MWDVGTASGAVTRVRSGSPPDPGDPPKDRAGSCSMPEEYLMRRASETTPVQGVRQRSYSRGVALAPISPVALGSIVIGAALLCAGLWMLRASAMPRREQADRAAVPARAMSFATRAAVGLSLMLAGYHAAAWGTPEGWLALRVPPERWYLLAGGILAALAVNFALDQRERDDSGPEASGRA